MERFKEIKKIIKITVLFFVILALTGFIYLRISKTTPPQTALTKKQTPIPSSIPKNADKVVAKVGSESIYQGSVNNQAGMYPSAGGTNQQKLALDRLINDSIVLQAAAKQKLITLDSAVYNSLELDVKKRALLVGKTKTLVENQADTISGSVISVWFLNDRVGPLGYEAGKKMAKEKIDNIYARVKSGKLTMKGAAGQISNDTSLAQLDPAYKSNAYFAFTINQDGAPTHSQPMNESLKTLPTGNLTEIFTIKSPDMDHKYEMVDAYYSFGTVTSKTSKGIVVSFDDWLNKAKKEYLVETF